MGKLNPDNDAFTIRPSKATSAKLAERAKFNHRSKSAEAVHLIELAMDLHNEKLVEELRRVQAISEQRKSG